MINPIQLEYIIESSIIYRQNQPYRSFILHSYWEIVIDTASYLKTKDYPRYIHINSI